MTREEIIEELLKLYISHPEMLTEEELENERTFYKSIIEIQCEKEIKKARERENKKIYEKVRSETQATLDENTRSFITDFVIRHFGEYPQRTRSKTNQINSPELYSPIKKIAFARSLQEVEDYQDSLLS